MVADFQGALRSRVIAPSASEFAWCSGDWLDAIEQPLTVNGAVALLLVQ